MWWAALPPSKKNVARRVVGDASARPVFHLSDAGQRPSPQLSVVNSQLLIEKPPRSSIPPNAPNLPPKLPHLPASFLCRQRRKLFCFLILTRFFFLFFLIMRLTDIFASLPEMPPPNMFSMPPKFPFVIFCIISRICLNCLIMRFTS